MSKFQFTDMAGTPCYPLITKDCIIPNPTAITYEGQEITLSRSQKCHITEAGTLSASSSGKSAQGILYTNGELYQFYDGGTVDVYDVTSIESGGNVSVKRTFSIPGVSSLHFGGVDWLNESAKILITHNSSNNSLYKINIFDEANITVQSIATPDIPSSVIAHEGIVCCDRVNNVIYLTGYLHENESNTNSTRTGLTIYKIDPNSGNANHVRDLPVFHLQDSIFHNSLIFYANDSTTGNGGGYNTQRIIAVSPINGIVATVVIPQITGREAEGISVINEEYIYETMVGNNSTIRVNKVKFL